MRPCFKKEELEEEGEKRKEEGEERMRGRE